MSVLRKKMKEKNITIVDLGEMTGRSIGYIRNIISGKGFPTPREQYLIAGILGVNIIDIFTPEQRVWHCPLCGNDLGRVDSVWGYCPECAIQVHIRTNAVYDIDENGDLRKRKSSFVD